MSFPLEHAPLRCSQRPDDHGCPSRLTGTILAPSRAASPGAARIIVPSGQSLKNLNAIPVVSPNGDLLKVHGPVRLHDGHLSAVGQEDDGGGRHDERWIGP